MRSLYPFIKLSKKNQIILFNVLLGILLGLIYVYTVLSEVQLNVTSEIVHQNTEEITFDGDLEKVEHISDTDDVYLKSGEKVSSGDVKKYVYLEQGTNTYYKDGTLFVPITTEKAREAGMRSLILHFAWLGIMIALLYYMKRYKFRWSVVLLALYVVELAFASTAFWYWGYVMLNIKIPVETIGVVELGVLVALTWLYRKGNVREVG